MGDTFFHDFFLGFMYGFVCCFLIWLGFGLSI